MSKGKKPTLIVLFPMKISDNQIVHNSFLCIDVFWLISKEEMMGLEHHFTTPNK